MPHGDIKFDEIQWAELIKKPTWYIEYVKFAELAKAKLGEETKELKELNKQVRGFFENALKKQEVTLAKDGPNLDEQREPIDTIVIHHTSAEPGYRLSYMNAVQLLNSYATYYANPRDERERSLKGRPIWSNHFDNGRQVFYLYHWFMRMDGSFIRLLDNEQIGWHAGNWEINKRSIAICLDNDYEHRDPTDEILQKLAAHIKHYYPNIKPSNIIGHCEARSGTICPGTNFLDGWKNNLLIYLT